MIVDTNQLVDVSDAVANLSDGWVLESSFWVLASVVEDARLLVDVVKFKRLQLSALPKLYVLQSFDVDDKSIWLGFSDGLLNLQVGELQHVSKPDTAVHHALGHHIHEVGGNYRIRHTSLGDVVYVLGDIFYATITKHIVVAVHHIATTIHRRDGHHMWDPLVNTPRTLLILKPLVKEVLVPVSVFFLFEVNLVYRDELKVHDVNHVLVVSVYVLLELVVVFVLVDCRRVIPCFVLDLRGNLLHRLFVKLSVCKTTKFVKADTLDAPSIHDVIETRVLRVAMHKPSGVYVFGNYTRVGVIPALYHSHPQSGQVVDTSSINTVVKVVPRKRHARPNLRRNLCVRLGVGPHKDFSLFKSLWKLLWVDVKHKPRLLLEGH